MFSKKNIHATIASLIHDLTVTSTPKIRLLKRTRPGVSALIAMIMVLAFMFTMSSVMIAMTRSLKIAQGGAAADQAYLNAVTGLELGLYQQNKPSTFVALVNGITGSSSYEVGQPVTIGNDKKNVISFKVTDTLSNGGKVCGDENSSTESACNANQKMYYVYPFPGSGTMGGNNCNAATQPIVKDEQWYRDMYFFITGKQYAGTAQLSEIKTTSGTNPNSPNNANSTSTKPSKDQWDEFTTVAYINSSKFTTLDHPCLWNKLEPGVSAEIPLYNGFIPSPKDITEFWLRVKMPCNSGTVCRDSDERMIVDVPTDPIKQAQRAILWDIVADCSKSPIDQVACFIKETIDKNAPNPLQQSIIQKQFLNNGNEIPGAYNGTPFKNIVLSFAIKENGTMPLYGQTSAPNKPDLFTPIPSFIKQLGVWKDMVNPTMHLSIASSLPLKGNINKGEIPYIQYQILYKTSLTGPADKAIITNPTVTSTGQNGGYTINLESSLTKQTGTYGYALIGK